MEIRKWSIAISLGLCVLAFGQKETQNDYSYISGGFTPGFLLAHRADIKHLAAHNYGLELSYEKESSGSYWGKAYKKPVIGYGVQYYNLGREETGHAIGAMMHFKWSLIDGERTSLRFRTTAGLAYLTERFDPLVNRRNQAIGSHINGSMQFGLLGHTQSRRVHGFIEYGIAISHYSNAAFKVPNLGYNMPSFILRYGYRLGEVKEKHFVDTVSVPVWRYRAVAIFGKKDRNFAAPQTFYNYGIQLRAIRKTKAQQAVRLGVDYTLDKSYKYSEDRFYPLDSISVGEQSEVGVAAGYQWSIAKVDAFFELGAYLYRPAVLKDAVNQRIGVAYRLTPKLNAQGALRFHRGVADFFEMGIGYTW